VSDRLVITRAECITAIGLDAASTAAASRCGISRLRQSRQYEDSYGSPIIESCLPILSRSTEPPEPEDAEQVEDDLGTDEPDSDDTDDEIDPYDLAREGDDVERITTAVLSCLDRLIVTGFPPSGSSTRHVVVLLGVAPMTRPGPRFEGPRQELGPAIAERLRPFAGHAEVLFVPTGNSSAIRALHAAQARLAETPSAVCIVGGFDSLLSLETLNWYEEAERLKSGSFGRNHGICPGEAVGLLVVESASAAKKEGRAPVAVLEGIGLATEPSPFLSDGPSRGVGLSTACRTALASGRVPSASIGTVLCDLDGEFHRAKEWALAEVRCLGRTEGRVLLHPADCYGSLGAASAAVLLTIGAESFARGWWTKPVLVSCSDDRGECGAVILSPERRQGGS
jgi:3-oxoacyl-[acyl-carrier-protein] synthase-1